MGRLCTACALAIVAAGTTAAAPATINSRAQSSATAASPASWKPWLLTSAGQFRLTAPPRASSAQTKAELRQLLRLRGTRSSPTAQAAIKKWIRQPAVVPWIELELEMIQNSRPTTAAAARALALTGAGIYDAMIAAEDSRQFYAKSTRPSPWKLDKRLKPEEKVPAGSTYAPYDAAIAGAAEKILAYLFPSEPKRTFTQAANEAVGARLTAGLNYPSDVQRARTLGQRIGALAIARGEADGHTNAGYSEGPFSGEQFWIRTPLSPTEVWEPTPPAEGTIGSAVATWRPWLLDDPRALWKVVPPPSPYGSPQFLAQVNAVLQANAALTDSQREIANFWNDGSGTVTPPGRWEQITLQLIKSYKAAAPQAVKAVAYLGVAEHDAATSWFGLAYHTWQMRPITAIWRLRSDGGLETEANCAAAPTTCVYRDKWYPLITTPQFPSYPSGHTTMAGLAGVLLAHFFPKAGGTFGQFADQVAISRLYAGVEFPEDSQAGLALGRAVAGPFLARAQADR